MQFISALIAGDNLEHALNAYIIHHSRFTLERDTEQLLHKAFALLSSFGYTDAATTVAQKRLVLFPHSASANYFASAMHGQPLPRSPDQYLIESFDSLAERFDEHLTGELGYDIPQKLAAALLDFVPTGKKLKLLDAGCGTGLCGPYLTSIAWELTGVDLSPKILEQAQKRQLYDSLVQSEITAFMTDTTLRFDGIIAADVLIYFGDLTSLAKAMANALTTCGLLAISTESCVSSGHPSGHQLLSSGRFAHDRSYVRAVFAEAFEELFCQDTTVRMEATRAVPGNIFIFRRLPA
jgi:predicted TPR repeat methyltransferase